MLFAKTKELLVGRGLRFGFVRLNPGTRQGVNASSPLPVLYFEPFSGAVKNFAKSRLCRVARKSIAFADFFPRKALNAAKGNFAGQTVAKRPLFHLEATRLRRARDRAAKSGLRLPRRGILAAWVLFVL